MMQITPTVKQLLIINILFFIGSQLVEPAEIYFSLYSYQSDNFKFWQLLTHMFMHGNIMHIFFNMFALYSFGSVLEHFWGAKRFLFFYISCGLGAALMQMGINYLELQYLLEGASQLNLSDVTLHEILNATVSQGNFYRADLFEADIRPILEQAGKLSLLDQSSFDALFESAKVVRVPMVGASGAIYGLLVAFAFMTPNAELALMFIPIPIKAKYFVPGLLCIDLFLGLKGNSIFGGGTGVAHFAHIGGAIVGFLMMWYWKKNSMNKHRWN
jgi:rhomboid family protein